MRPTRYRAVVLDLIARYSNAILAHHALPRCGTDLGNSNAARLNDQ